MRILIDTNILIPLEDPSLLLNAAVARLARLAAEHRLHVLVHPASLDDLKRDPNEERRGIVLSKARKYVRLEHAATPSPEFLAEVGGNSSDQSRNDNRLLFAVVANAVDLLVTQDKELHAKARRVGLSERVYYVTQAVSLIEGLHAERKRVPPTVERRPLHSLSLEDTFFDSLRDDYDFDAWFQKIQREGREGWLIRGDGGTLEALCVFKRETDAMPSVPGLRLKLCTFKVSPEASGRKLGELLLKTAFQHCLDNQIPRLYVTAFPRHQELIHLFGLFGFQVVERSARGELVMAKSLTPPLTPPAALLSDPVAYNVLYYPHFLEHQDVGKFIVPVSPAFHTMLFPEWMPQQSFLPSTSPASNALRKAYICNANTRQLKPGDLAFFYRSQDAKQVTTVGVVERVLRSSNPDEIAAFVGRRTVYSLAEIQRMCAGKEALAFVFRQCRHAGRPLPYQWLKATGILTNHVESITNISHAAATLLIREAAF